MPETPIYIGVGDGLNAGFSKKHGKSPYGSGLAPATAAPMHLLLWQSCARYRMERRPATAAGIGPLRQRQHVRYGRDWSAYADMAVWVPAPPHTVRRITKR